MNRLLCFVALAGFLSYSSAVRAETSETMEDYLSSPTYRAQTPVDLPSSDRGVIEVPAGGVLTVIETQKDAQGVEYTRLGLDTEVPVNSPSDFWVPSHSLDQSGLQLLAEIERRMTYCYRYVKLYLLKKGLVKTYLPGGSAWMAKDVLPKYGFARTGRGPLNSRVNEVCVYYGGTGGNGHIEVLAPQGWYYGYGYSASPISQNGRRLIACYAKGR